MEGLKVLRNTQIIFLGLMIAAATVISSVIFARSFTDMKRFASEVISVTGSAEKKIISDLVVWRAAFSRRDPALPGAFGAVHRDLARLQEYLKSKGIGEEDIVIPQASTAVLYHKTARGADTHEIEGYEVTQAVEVRSRDVLKVARVSRQSTELLNEGIPLMSNAPEYFYTGLAGLKVEMLGQAIANARERAQSMAGAAGSRVGLMRHAKMGVFQITPVNSYDVSWYGENDTTSYAKKVTAVVEVTFAISE